MKGVIAVYIYESCTGSLFTREEYLDYKDLYCEQCGDHGRLLGKGNTKKDFLKILNKEGFSEECIQDFIREEFKR